MPSLDDHRASTVLPTRNGAGFVPDLRYRRLFETAADGILVWSADTGTIVDANPRIVEMLGRSREHLVGRRAWDVEPLQDLAAAIRPLHSRRTKGPVRADGVPLEVGDGRTRRVDAVAVLVVVGGERLIQCSVRERARRHEAGIASSAVECLARELHRSGRRGETVCVGLVRFDREDHRGSVAELIQSRLRGSDLVARQGDAALVLILPEMSLEDGRRRIAGLRDEVERLTGGSVTAGITAGPQHGHSAETLLRAVDQRTRIAS